MRGRLELYLPLHINPNNSTHSPAAPRFSAYCFDDFGVDSECWSPRASLSPAQLPHLLVSLDTSRGHLVESLYGIVIVIAIIYYHYYYL